MACAQRHFVSPAFMGRGSLALKTRAGWHGSQRLDAGPRPHCLWRRHLREILHVDDLVRAEAVILAPEKVAGEAFNIGGGPTQAISLLDLIDTLEARLQEKIPLRWGEWRPGDQRIYVSDIRKLGDRLGC